MGVSSISVGGDAGVKAEDAMGVSVVGRSVSFTVGVIAGSSVFEMDGILDFPLGGTCILDCHPRFSGFRETFSLIVSFPASHSLPVTAGLGINTSGNKSS